MATINFYATGCDYIAHANFSVSPDPYPNGIDCPRLNVANITGTVRIYASEVYCDSGYSLPADVYVNGQYVDYLQSTSVSFSSSGVTNVQVIATRKATAKSSVVIAMGTGISGFSYSYYYDGALRSGSSSSSTRTISADVGTDITITGFTYSSASYGTPVEFAEYTNSAHTTLVTKWNYPTDPKIRVKSSYRYFVFTASVQSLTYYGRLRLEGNGGKFGSQTYINWPSVAQPASGVGGALISITLPTATQTSSIPTRTGYTFAGWAGSDSSTTVEYGYGGKVSFTAKSTYQSSPTEVTLFAVWTKTYTVSFRTAYSGVTNMPSDLTGLTSGSWVNLPSNIPALARHEFVGWATSSGGSVAYYPNGGFRISSDVTLWTVFERIQIELFFWNGNDVADANLIAKGKPVSNITAVRWNSLLAKIKELADACGVDFSYTTVSSGQDITAVRFNEARTGLSKIKTALGATTILPAAQSRGYTIYATLFTGNGSLKGALNALIGAYNNG